MDIEIKTLDIQIKTTKLRAGHVKQMQLATPAIITESTNGAQALGYIFNSKARLGILLYQGDYYKILLGNKTSVHPEDKPSHLFCDGSEIYRNYILTPDEIKELRLCYDRLTAECLKNHIYI